MALSYGYQLISGERQGKNVMTDAYSVIRPLRQGSQAERQGNGNYAYVCFKCDSNLSGNKGVHSFGDGRYALVVRSDKELHDGTSYSAHSESLLLDAWNGLKKGGNLIGLKPLYVFSERVPCIETCHNNCVSIVGETHLVYYIATYERSWAYSQIQANARNIIRNFYDF